MATETYWLEPGYYYFPSQDILPGENEYIALKPWQTYIVFPMKVEGQNLISSRGKNIFRNVIFEGFSPADPIKDNSTTSDTYTVVDSCHVRHTSPMSTGGLQTGTVGGGLYAYRTLLERIGSEPRHAHGLYCSINSTLESVIFLPAAARNHQLRDTTTNTFNRCIWVQGYQLTNHNTENTATVTLTRPTQLTMGFESTSSEWYKMVTGNPAGYTVTNGLDAARPVTSGIATNSEARQFFPTTDQSGAGAYTYNASVDVTRTPGYPDDNGVWSPTALPIFPGDEDLHFSDVTGTIEGSAIDITFAGVTGGDATWWNRRFRLPRTTLAGTQGYYGLKDFNTSGNYQFIEFAGYSTGATDIIAQFDNSTKDLAVTVRLNGSTLGVFTRSALSSGAALTSATGTPSSRAGIFAAATATIQAVRA